MRNLSLIFAFLLFIAFVKKSNYTLHYPSYWPKPSYNFSNNPLDSNKIKLGRVLFYDPILSRDNTISCASCHLPYTGFTHTDHDLSHGIDGKIGKRNSIALVNLAWAKNYMWDGAVHHLDVQALAPIEHPSEMGHTLQQIIQKLKQSSDYKSGFKKAFGDTSITGERILKAIAQFNLTLISANAKYDKVMANNSNYTFTAIEKEGYTLFKKYCNKCHTEPLFSNYSFENNGLAMDTSLMDKGRMAVTNNPNDSLKFKVPTLRNLSFTAPYMHDGRYKNLQMVIYHYSTQYELTEQDKGALLAFLRTLNDESFIKNKDYQYLPSSNLNN